MSERHMAWFHELSRHDVLVAGGKGANLGDMAQAGLPIPPGFVICAPAYRYQVSVSGLDEQIRVMTTGIDYGDCDCLMGVEQKLRELFEHVPTPEALGNEIVHYYHKLCGDCPAPVAVRSSATAEDLVGASFAGQQETFLNVCGEDALLVAVRRCWSSLYTSQAMFYRCQNGFDQSTVSMAVVVQRMVESEKSGVIFTVDPVTCNHYNMMIEAVWGLGEGIVSGTITPDHYTTDRETFEIVDEFVPEKQIMICKCADGGVVTLPVPPERVAARVVDAVELRQLTEMGNRVQAHFGVPQDIEWGAQEGRFYLLQSRPITCL
jgi:pyruvate, water dikinase